MAQQYLWWDSAAAAERSARRLLALRPAETSAWSNLIEPLLRQGRAREGAQAQDRVTPDSGDLTNSGFLFRDAIRWGRFTQLDPALRETAKSRKGETRSEAWWLLMLSLRDQGRLREADSIRRVWRAASIAKGNNPADQPADLMMGIAVLRPAIRGGGDGSNTYTSRTDLHEVMALAFEQADQADGARFHWRAVESAWREADPQFRDRDLVAKQKAGL